MAKNRRTLGCFAALALVLLLHSDAVETAGEEPLVTTSLDYFADAERTAVVQPADVEDEELPEEPAPPPRPAPRRARRTRLASVPQMFGDFSGINGQIFAQAQQGGDFQTVVADLPCGRRAKIGENNYALTNDRVYFTFNHFHNALRVREALATAPPPPAPPPVGLPPGFNGPQQRFPLDRYTLGIEKRVLGDCCSIEVRMPLMGSYSAQSAIPVPTVTYGAEGGNIGNLAIILKWMVKRTETLAVAAGVGVDLPTGSDVFGRVEFPFDPAIGFAEFVVRNQSVHVSPYIAVTGSPSERCFFNAFAQLDLTASGNRVDVVFGGSIPPASGKHTDQHLLFLDAAFGYWLYRNESARHFRGLAGVAEIHYGTTLHDGDAFQAVVSPTMTSLSTASFLNRIDSLNLTAGLHAQLGEKTNVRIGAVVPLRHNMDPLFGATDRLFDAEIQLQVNRRF